MRGFWSQGCIQWVTKRLNNEEFSGCCYYFVEIHGGVLILVVELISCLFMVCDYVRSIRWNVFVLVLFEETVQRPMIFFIAFFW